MKARKAYTLTEKLIALTVLAILSAFGILAIRIENQGAKEHTTEEQTPLTATTESTESAKLVEQSAKAIQPIGKGESLTYTKAKILRQDKLNLLTETLRSGIKQEREGKAETGGASKLLHEAIGPFFGEGVEKIKLLGIAPYSVTVNIPPAIHLSVPHELKDKLSLIATTFHPIEKTYGETAEEGYTMFKVFLSSTRGPGNFNFNEDMPLFKD